MLARSRKSNKSKFNILKYQFILKKLIDLKINTLIHTAALSRPMVIHDSNIEKSIDTNIIGTCNVVKACQKLNIKLIYFSTSYVYPGTQGNYDEESLLKPINNYAWSKLGGESAVQMYKNSLILRIAMTEYPFVHKKAYANVKSNFIFQEDAAKIILKILDKKGLFNVGGTSRIIYNFIKQSNKTIKKIYSKGEFPIKMDMNLNKLKKFLN